MSPVHFAVLCMVAFWLFGGIVARFAGLLLVFVGAATLALDPQVGAALPIAIGVAAWLAGHWHYALRHHKYKSPLAGYVFLRWAPAWLDPTRDWAIPVADGEAVDSERRSR